MIILLARTILWMGRVFDFALLARAIMSWFVRPGYGSDDTLSKVYDALVKYTEPIVSPVRNLINKYFRTGFIDLSIFATMVLMSLVINVVIKILLLFA